MAGEAAPRLLWRRLWRTPVLIGWLLLIVPMCLPHYLSGRELPGRFRRFCYARVCRIAGIRVRVSGRPLDGPGVLFAANHVSYIDIVALGAALDAHFVAKSEVARWPLFGHLARLSGSLFIDRDRRQALTQSSRLATHLSRGRRLCLFPEGTSSDGRQVLSFKSALFHGLTGAGACIQPVTVAYRNDPDARYAWHGEMTLVPHLLDILGRRGVEVELMFHPPVEPKAFASRKILARHVEQQVRAGLDGNPETAQVA